MTIRSILDVTAAAAGYDLTTLTVVKDELQIADTASDSWLSRQITNASKSIANYCNRVFQVETLTETLYIERDAYPYQVPGSTVGLQLARWPIKTLTSVTANGTVLTADTDYKVNKAVGQVYRLDMEGLPRLWDAWPTIIVYDAGYDTIPEDLADACVLMVKKRWYSRGRDPLVKVDEVAGIGRQEYWVSTGSDGAFPPDIADMIDNYRVPVTA